MIMPEAAVVIAAAGSSSRIGGIKKEYRQLKTSDNGMPETVLGTAARAFASVPSVEIIVIVIPENGENDARSTLPPEILSAEKPRLFFVSGGNSRRASVFNALSFLAEYNPRFVLIHDGARPWVSPSLIEQILDAVKKTNAVIPLLPLADTPKECDAPLPENHLHDETVFIRKHLKRLHTGIAQTPQAFAFPEILTAHKKAAELVNEDFTDDAEVWGRFCGPVAVIPGEQKNRKITFPEDLNS
jgi:2-C-methyl-D-erythritol 4-phosphate cytidylyltransferase/2-C-methyl-D-erythritol 4-phosphate cytidylyltransferase/2-C-methyl-D-erythritol 2,4-cyclodiphosphate synthase